MSWFKHSKVFVLFAHSFALVIACSLLLTCNEVKAKSIYDEQASFTNEELVTFIELLPNFRAWARSSDTKSHPIVNEMGKADFIYSKEAAEWVVSQNWKPERFFFVMGRAAAAIAIIEDGNDLLTRRPTDMPTVPETELALVRQHLGALLKSGKNSVSIKQ